MVLVFNDKQNDAICSDNKFTLIDAGPGAGKTRVLIERIKYLLKNKGADPDTLLIITFTNKATDELRLRLLEDPDINEETLSRMHISTIHSFCKVLLDKYDETQYNLLADDDDFNERMIMFMRKNRKKLGFINENYITGGELARVIDLYDEFTVFEVDDYLEDLKKYIRENYPVNSEYIDYIRNLEYDSNGNILNFPLDDVKENYKEDWYNQKFYHIVASYPRFKQLLEKENYLDYNFLQIRACEFLESDKIEDFPFENILVDEFQDIDPIQDKIFDAIIKNYNIETFTVVGDADQSIYGFRGSDSSYFSNFSKKYNCKPFVLDTNYRSKSEIVEFTEDFIKKYRDMDYSKDLKSSRGSGGKVYYMENIPNILNSSNNFNSIKDLKESSGGNFKISDLKKETKVLEFKNISKLIKQLLKTGKIEKYSDVGILFRSMNSANGLTIDKELDTLSEEGIPFTLNVPDSLINKDEIRIAVFLLSYIRKVNPPFFTSFEKDWLNPSFFTKDEFKSFYKFTDESCEILNNIEEEYRKNIIRIENEVSKDFEDSKKRRSYNKVFEEKNEVLKVVFEKSKDLTHDLSNLTRKDLENIGFKDINDVDFILSLNKLKKDFNEKKCDILTLFYSLLELGDYFKKISENQIANLAYFTRIISNYMDIISSHDLNGFIWYLNSYMDLYSSIVSVEEDKGVNILTIHKAKGLEFPVVIIPSFEEDKFPRKYKEMPEVSSKYGFYTTYNIVPNQFFKYKNHNKELNEKLYIMEEERVIYVAMTRARDLLILSSIPHKTKEGFLNSSSFINKITKYKNIEKLDTENLPKCQHIEHENIGEVIDLSFSKYSDYIFCPYGFKLSSIHDLQVPTKDILVYGTVIHEILENLGNISHNNNNKIDNQIIKNETDKVFKKYNFTNKEDENINDIKNNVKKYWDKFGANFKVIGTEIPFNLSHKNYQLNGFIDLVIEKPDGTLKIIDYKNTSKNHVLNDKESYARQLYIYYNSIKEMPEYKNYKITGLSILALKDNAEIEMPIDLNKIQHVNEDLEIIAEKIINKEFPKTPKKEENCEKCDYKNICNKNKLQT